jgi:sulfur transfer complex TusBCD TusB component (DsrH family)
MENNMTYVLKKYDKDEFTYLKDGFTYSFERKNDKFVLIQSGSWKQKNNEQHLIKEAEIYKLKGDIVSLGKRYIAIISNENLTYRWIAFNNIRESDILQNGE